MCVKRQSIEHVTHGLLIDLQPLHQAGLGDFIGPIRASPELLAFPLIEQQIDGVGIEGFALLWERAPTPGMQRGHEGEQQRASGQLIQARVAGNGLVEQHGTSLRFVGGEVANLHRHTHTSV